MSESKRTPITYADSRADLPVSDFAARLAELRIARTFEARAKAPEQDNAPGRHASPDPHRQDDPSMVEQERPHPVLKPSPSLAGDVDAAAFNARWDAEQRRTTQSYASTPNQGERPMSDQFQNQSQGQTSGQTQPRRPEDTLREGQLKAAIWRNENDKGAYHSVTVARTYKDRDGNLQDTQSFRAKDMLGLSELARRAHHEVNELDRAAFKEQRQEQAQQQGQTKGHDQSR